MSSASKNSFDARDTLTAGSRSYEVYRLDALERRGIGHVSKLPFSLRVLLENLLRC
jgi:aconitate hydratase